MAGRRGERRATTSVALISAVLMVSACASVPQRPSVVGSDGAAAGPAPGRAHTVVFLTHVEPNTLSQHRAFTGTGATAADAISLFNAALFLDDSAGVAHPALAARAPTLGDDSWVVNADGTMDTTYALRPGLVWHDGASFTARDMVLSWQVARNPDFGVANLLPTKLMREVEALDDQTVRVHWSETYPQADALKGRDWAPLPDHLLGQAFASQSSQAFAANAYWTQAYVGLGPFRLDRWDPGSALDGSAFDGYALGRPKIQRIQVRFAPDPNTALASLLSGDADMAIDFALGFDQGELLRKRWAATSGGRILLDPAKLRYLQIQLRPAYANPPQLLDLRVRQALTHALDRQSLIDALLDGQGQPAEAMAPPLTDYAAEVDRAITRYPYDVSRADQLLRDAGLIRASTGPYVTATGATFALELQAAAGGQEQQEHAIVSDSWRRAGIDVQSHMLSTTEEADRQARSTFPAVGSANTGLEEQTLFLKLFGPNIATADRQWAGSNRGGWSNPVYDRFYERMTSSLDRSERVDAIVQAARIVSEEVPVIPMYNNFVVEAHTAALHGPQAYAPGGSATWDVQNWEYR
ncbi:MAG TPA: peptide ABC transporter substrate-binding protein [Chloroflexota bacterium]|nr:peptide ABC transporter substrate-binding protein [Chloroflexota bacterium]